MPGPVGPTPTVFATSSRTGHRSTKGRRRGGPPAHRVRDLETGDQVIAGPVIIWVDMVYIGMTIENTAIDVRVTTNPDWPDPSELPGPEDIQVISGSG